MRNVWRLFIDDLTSLKANVIAAIVAMGLLLTASLYAWFSLLAFWDPYAQTDELDVAVANADQGYESQLFPTRVNTGDAVVNALRANDEFHWVFTTPDEAVEGVKSGEYFAALVIPEDFSTHLLQVFSDPNAKDVGSTIDYYVNQKTNAVAPELTTEGAFDLEHEVNTQFAKTVASVALGTASDLMSFMDGDGISSYGSRLLGTLNEILADLEQAKEGTSAFADLAGACSTLLEASGEVLDELGTLDDTVQPLLDEAQSGLSEGATALESVEGMLNAALADTEAALDSLASAANGVLDAAEDAVPAAQQVLGDASSDAATLASAYGEVRAAVAAIDPGSPAIAAIDQAIAVLDALSDDLSHASQDLGQTSANVEASREEIEREIASAKQALGEVKDAAAGTIAADAKALQEKLQTIRDDALALGEQASSEVETLSETATTLSGDLAEVQASLDAMTSTLSSTKEHLAFARDQLASALASGDLQQIRAIIGSDPGGLASFLSAPTTLTRHEVFPMANNGSAMAPFYLSLAIWIGCIFEVALVRTSVSDARREKVEAATGKPLTANQCYLGRYFTFALISVGQTTILMLGAILFLRIQCDYPLLLVASGWVASIVFSNIIYTLVLSFGRVGEALAVVGLVAQIAGAGGVFPVQVSGPVFVALYPWLPFSHSMLAFSSCIAGVYGNQLALALATLAAFLVPFLLLGLALRKPIIKLNDYVDEKLEASHLIFKE